MEEGTTIYPIICLGENEQGEPVLVRFENLATFQQADRTRLLVGQWWTRDQGYLAQIALIAYKFDHDIPLTDEEREQAAQLLWDSAYQRRRTKGEE